MENDNFYDTSGTDEIVCPYCGCEFGDSWEYNDQNNQVISCQDCSKKFKLYVNFQVDYSTDKLKEDN